MGIVGVTKSTFYLTPQFINRSRLVHVSVSIFAMGDESSVMIISDFREESESAELWMIGWGREGHPPPTEILRDLSASLNQNSYNHHQYLTS